jgi:hypothetical protein
MKVQNASSHSLFIFLLTLFGTLHLLSFGKSNGQKRWSVVTATQCKREKTLDEQYAILLNI